MSLHLAMILLLNDESTDRLPGGSMAATQSLEVQALAAGHCCMIPHTCTEYCAKLIIGRTETEIKYLVCCAIFSIFDIFSILRNLTPGLPSAGRQGVR
jgi:hypothetical protein